MLTGHNSHQIGLDADIWLTPMPNRELTRREREEMSATMMVAADRKDVDPEVWTPAHTEIIKAAAKDPIVERIFVNAAIKKALCREAGNDRSWLHKVRPYYGHDYHFHVRIKCPADSPDCRPQDPVPAGEVCGNDLDHWFTDAILYPRPSPIPSTPKPPLTMADLPRSAAGALARLHCWLRGPGKSRCPNDCLPRLAVSGPTSPVPFCVSRVEVPSAGAPPALRHFQ